MTAEEYLKSKFIDPNIEVDSLIPGVGSSYFKLQDLLNEYAEQKCREQREACYEYYVNTKNRVMTEVQRRELLKSTPLVTETK